MATRCDVCGEYPIRGAVRTFFPWPTDPSQRTYWQTCLGVQDLNLNKPELFICSDHFDQMQMIRKGTALRKDAFPKRYDGPLPTFLEEDGAPKVEPPSEDVKNEDVGIFDDPGPSAPVFDDEEIMPEELSMAKLVQMFAAAAKERPTTIAPFVTPISEETRAFSNILIDRQEKYLETYCKSCLRQAELVNMLEANCEGVPVTLMYKAVFMTEITPSDVPQLMCHTCIGLLFQCFKFSTMSARSCEVLQAARERFKYLSPLDDGTIDLKNIPDKYSAKPCPRPESDVEDQKDDVKVVKRSVKKRKSVVKSKEVPPEKKGRRTSTRRASEQAKKVSKKILEDSDEDDSNNDNFDNDEADPDFDAQEVKDESPEVSDAEVEEKEEDKDDQDPEDNYCMLCRHQFSNMARHMDKVHRVDWESKSCERCEVIFDSVKKLFKHYLKHENIKCKECRMVYDDKKGLERHLKLSTCGENLEILPKKEKKVSTSVKTKRPRSEKPRERPKAVKTIDPTFYCKLCEYDSESFKEMFAHIQANHKDHSACALCEKHFENKYKLLAHYKLHGKYKYCADHYVAFDTEEELLDHTMVPGHDLQCGICQKMFKTRKRTVGHRQKLHYNNPNQDQRRLLCSECPLSFRQDANLRRHVLTVHRKRVFLCEDCGQPFTTNLRLRRHLAKKHGKGDKQIFHQVSLQCDTCGKKLRDITAFKKHKAMHLGHTEFCGYCRESFVNLDALDQHVKISGHTWLTCHQCSGKYKTETLLSMHLVKCGLVKKSTKPTMRDGKPIKPKEKRGTFTHKLPNGYYGCNFCKKQFSQCANAYRHSSIHLGKQFNCDICGKSFSQKQGLKTHLTTHSEERPLKCPICGAAFKDGSTLSKHKKAHTTGTFVGGKKAPGQFSGASRSGTNAKPKRNKRQRVESSSSASSHENNEEKNKVFYNPARFEQFQHSFYRQFF